MPKFEELNNPNLVGEILKRERAADAEKFPAARQIIADLEEKMDAIPPLTEGQKADISEKAAGMAAKNAPTPLHDMLYKKDAK